MNHYAELDNDVREISTAGHSKAEATIFLHGLRKLAAGPAAPDAVVEHEAAVATGAEASPAEAEAHTEAATPDDTGHLEGEFAMPVEHIVMTLAAIVANNQRQHTAYAVYGEMMRGLGRGELAELFDEQAKGELKEMKYFLRRISVLSPGGVPIPVSPTPPPSAKVEDALKYLIAGEQQAIVLFKTLHAQLGENPMKFTMEQIMTDAQEHLDRLWQYMPETKVPKKTAGMHPKVASVLAKLAVKGEEPQDTVRETGQPKEATKVKSSAPQQPIAKPGDVATPPVGAEPIEAVLSRETQLAHAQSMAENQDLRTRLDAASQQMQQQDMAIESLQAENSAVQMQAETATQEADMARQETQMATEEATMQSENAAAQADSKMRMSMRIQQFRQQLSDIVSQDVVGEEGAGFGEQAGPGAPVTSSQQQQAAEQQMAEEQAAAEAQGGKPKAKPAPKAEPAPKTAARKIADDNENWLNQFANTPLYDTAVQLAEADLSLEEERVQEDLKRPRKVPIHQKQDALRIQKKRLELELAKHRLGAVKEEPKTSALLDAVKNHRRTAA